MNLEFIPDTTTYIHTHNLPNTMLSHFGWNFTSCSKYLVIMVKSVSVLVAGLCLTFYSGHFCTEYEWRPCLTWSSGFSLQPLWFLPDFTFYMTLLSLRNDNILPEGKTRVDSDSLALQMMLAILSKEVCAIVRSSYPGTFILAICSRVWVGDPSTAGFGGSPPNCSA